MVWSYVIGSNAVASASATYSGTLTLKAVIRGNFIWCYADAALLFSGPIDCGTVALASRGLLAEENCGVIIDAAVGTVDTSNYCTSFTMSGVATAANDKTIGNIRLLIDPVIREMYVTDSADSDANLFWSRGIQHSHFSEGDIGERALPVVTGLKKLKAMLRAWAS